MSKQFEYNSRVSEWGTEMIGQLQNYNTREASIVKH